MFKIFCNYNHTCSWIKSSYDLEKQVLKEEQVLPAQVEGLQAEMAKMKRMNQKLEQSIQNLECNNISNNQDVDHYEISGHHDKFCEKLFKTYPSQ